jgi:hypothetical protein
MRAAVAAWWAVSAAGLGLVAVATRPTAEAVAPPGVVRLGVDPGERIGLERREASGASERIGVDSSGEPVWVRARATGGVDSWPVAPARYAAGVRLLATAALERRAARTGMGEGGLGETGLGAGAVRVELARPDGSTRVLLLGGATLGGRAAAELDGEPVWVSASLGEALAQTGFAPWRETRLLVREGEEPERIELTAGGSRVVLERRGRRWWVTEPVVMQAHEPAARELVGVLGGVEAASIDQGAAFDEAVRSEGVATIEASGQRDGTSWRRRVAVRGAMAGEAVQAAATWWVGEDTRHGPALVRVPAAMLTRLSADPLAYVRRSPSGVSAADVVGVRVTRGDGSPGLELVRTPAGGWARSESAGTGVELTGTEAAGATGLVDMLTASEGQPVWVMAPPDDSGPPAGGGAGVIVELLGPGAGGPAVVDRLRVRAEPGAGTIVIGPASEARGAESGPSVEWSFGAAEVGAVVGWVESALTRGP